MDFSVQQHLLPPVVMLSMVTIGMELRLRQFQDLLSTPRIPLVGTLVHTLSFPIIAVALVTIIKLFKLDVADATLAGILLIAACPSGGFSNILVLIARANLPLSVILTAISSVLAFVSVPLLVASFAFILEDLNRPIELPVAATLLQLFLLILLPISAGMLIRHRWPERIDRLIRPMQNAGQVLLYVAVALLVVENLDTVKLYARDALPWSISLCALNLLVCYQASRIFGLDVEDRITIALEGSIRNLAVALLVAVNVMGRMDIAVLPTVYFVAVLIVAIAFAKLWRHLIREPQPHK